MKTMYRVNLVFLLINALLFLVPMLGMLFMIPLGILQLVCSVWLLTQQERTSRSVQWMTVLHLFLSILVLFTMFFLANDNHSLNYDMVETTFLIGMIISGLLALFFMFISYTCHIEYQKYISNQ